ncbi:hypothetical protein BDR26DRAFT_863914 [Obelidium mucronatum]|nr:hypothetical protein BDR26DRAFT_863914 [Obelidium mucronatum]
MLLVHAMGQTLTFNVGRRSDFEAVRHVENRQSGNSGRKNKKERPAVREKHYMLSQGDNNTTIVSVTTRNQTVAYTIPSGCSLHRVFSDRITILPTGYVYDDAVGLPKNNPCPFVLHRPCDVVPVCKRFPGFKTPTKDSKCQYSRVLTDSEVKGWNMDLCMVRKADCKMLWTVDKCNSKS